MKKQVSIQNRATEPTPFNNKKIINSGVSLKEKGSSWVYVFDQLQTEIKIRHYSPKTLKAYRSWISNFQNFTKSKNYRLIVQKDVIYFFAFWQVADI